jgi:CheY-like chemotaxis protein
MNKAKIMVVDDSEQDQFLFSLLVEECYPQIELLQAYDGEEALSLLKIQETNPVVIFLDINMPRMNGHEFLTVYADELYRQAIPVIVLTSSIHDEDRATFTTFQCIADYWVKPLSVQMLQSVSHINGILS